MEGVVILYETIHELHTKKQNGVIFKIDFEKAYDKVKWSFLQQTLRLKGFSSKWCRWVEGMISGGNVGIKVNDGIDPYFQTKRGLRQGDPMSPILFNIIADMLALIIKRAKDDGQIRGVIPNLLDDGLSILQYADDTIIFIDHDLEQAKNLKLLLCAFEQLFGLKINFHKSEFFFATERLKRCKIFILISLVVMLGNILLNIWVFQCTIESYSILSGEKLKNVFRKNSLVGKLSTCLMGAVWFC